MHNVPKNFIWDSLVGEHKHLSIGSGKARRYKPEVAPWAALYEKNSECLKDLAAIVSLGETVLLRDALPAHSGEWVIEQENDSVQFVYPSSKTAVLQNDMRELNHTHLPAMIDLINLVLPGYFRKESMEMGKFFGIFDGEKLIAMAGERVFAKPYKEITAVCTLPGYQGQGLGAKVVEHLSAHMQQAGFIPFLHTHLTNTNAIKLYTKLGFDQNAVLPLIRIRRV